MAIPAWFEPNTYMSNKLKQLQASEPDANWTLPLVYDAFTNAGYVGDEGIYKHFEEYGNTVGENIAPNSMFVASEYYQFKALEYYTKEVDPALTEDEVKNDLEQYALKVKQLIDQAGMSAWDHYQNYGSKEGVNPSNAFSESKYLQAKADALNANGSTDPEGNAWTADSVKEAIEDAGMTVLGHYMEYAGKSDDEVASDTDVSVPENEQVNGGGENAGGTFTLTVGEDHLTGTDNDDTFEAYTAAGGANTLEDVDVLDGGKGTDTLKATITTADATPTMTAVENIEVRFLTGNKLVLSNATGVEKITVSGNTADDGEVDAVGTAKLVVSDTDHTVKFDGITSETLDLTVSNVGQTAQKAIDLGGTTSPTSTGLTLAVTDSNVELVDTGAAAAFTAATITASGTNVVKNSAAATVETLAISGDGSLDISEVAFTALKTLTSDASGALKIATKGSVLESATLGAGNDELTISTDAVTAAAKIDMGDGDNRLLFGGDFYTEGATLAAGSGEADVLGGVTAAGEKMLGGTDTERAAITGFEALEVTDAIADTKTFDLSAISGLTSFVADLGVAAGGTATVSNVGAGATVQVGTAATAGGNIVAGKLTVALKDATGTSDSVNVLLVTDDTANSKAVLDTSGIETVTFTHTGALSDTVKVGELDLTDDALVSLTIAGEDSVKYTAKAANLALTTVDASANTGGVELAMDAAMAQAVTIKGTNADDAITLSALDVAYGNGGDDTFSVKDANTTQVIYGTVADADAGDIIDFGVATTTIGAKITLGSQAVFSDYVEAACTDTAETNWFTFGGETFVVVSDGTAGFAAGDDVVVSLAGTECDIANATCNGNTLELA